MSNTLAMQYGTAGKVNTNRSDIVASGEVANGNSVDIILDAGGLYELFTAEFTTSSGVYRGHRSRLIKVPESALYGTVAAVSINESNSSNSGVTITMAADSTVTIAAMSTYTVRYAVRKVF